MRRVEFKYIVKTYGEREYRFNPYVFGNIVFQECLHVD